MTLSVKKLVIEVSQILKSRHLMLATAESCTGGGLSYALTEIPGSSTWFERGFITYSNEAKMEMLNVPVTILKKEGAVSEAVARAMALGALQASRAQTAIAITGIAGPSGGTPQKPVGTVWFAYALSPTEVYSQCEFFSGERHIIRKLAIREALNQFLHYLKK